MSLDDWKQRARERLDEISPWLRKWVGEVLFIQILVPLGYILYQAGIAVLATLATNGSIFYAAFIQPPLQFVARKFWELIDRLLSR
jgi:hypothetical protein